MTADDRDDPPNATGPRLQSRPDVDGLVRLVAGAVVALSDDPQALARACCECLQGNDRSAARLGFAIASETLGELARQPPPAAAMREKSDEPQRPRAPRRTRAECQADPLFRSQAGKR
jgi:hypothetical protein